MAKSYTKSKDGLRWVFDLQENVFFHDGSIFDAQTVKFVINRNKTFTKGPSYIWSNVETIEVLNKYTVQINLNEPVPLDLILSSQYGAWMYSTKFNEILGVSLDRTDRAWRKAIADDGLKWIHVSDLSYFNTKAARDYQVSSIPQTFLIDPQGKIRFKQIGGVSAELMQEQVDEMLGQG